MSLGLTGRFIEIEFENGIIEKYKIERVFASSGDIKIDRKGQNRIELVSKMNEYYLRSKNRFDGQPPGYKWCDAYLKNSKTHQSVRVRGCDNET